MRTRALSPPVHCAQCAALLFVYNICIVYVCMYSQLILLCLGETISIVYDMEGQNFEVDGGSSVALCQWKKCKLQHQPGFTEQ